MKSVRKLQLEEASCAAAGWHLLCPGVSFRGSPMPCWPELDGTRAEASMPTCNDSLVCRWFNGECVSLWLGIPYTLLQLPISSSRPFKDHALVLQALLHLYRRWLGDSCCDVHSWSVLP